MGRPRKNPEGESEEVNIQSNEESTNYMQAVSQYIPSLFDTSGKPVIDSGLNGGGFLIGKQRSLVGKLAKVAKECGYAQKDAKNDFHKYKYVSAANILGKVNEALSEHGLCSTVAVEVLSETVAENRYATVRVNVTIHDSESFETLVTQGIGCGQDKGDKAVMKAQTAALKYAWMLALNISTGDDPEADSETDKVVSVATQRGWKPAVTAPSNDGGSTQVAQAPVQASFDGSTWPSTPGGKSAKALYDAAKAKGLDIEVPSVDIMSDGSKLSIWTGEWRAKMRETP